MRPFNLPWTLSQPHNLDHPASTTRLAYLPLLMSSSICISSSSTNDRPAIQASEFTKLNRQQRMNRSEEMLFRRKEPQRAREMFCKRPSELRSRRTPKGTIIRLSELDQQDSDQMLEDESTLRKAVVENAAAPGLDEPAGGTTQNIISDSNKVIEVPLLSLVINKRKGKSKSALFNLSMCTYSIASHSSHRRL